MGLQKDHLTNEFQIKGERSEDIKLLDNFEKQTAEFDAIVKSASMTKQGLRKEISDLQMDIRKVRDQAQDKKSECKKLELIIKQEQDLAKERNTLES